MYFTGKMVLPITMAVDNGLKRLPPEEKPKWMHMQDNWEKDWTVVEWVTIKKEYLIECAEMIGLKDYSAWNRHTSIREYHACRAAM